MPSDNFRFRNHYIPAHYLKRWAAGTQKIWTYRLLVPHDNVHLWKQHSLETIGRREHLYTRIRDGNYSDELERWFSADFECLADPVIEKVTTAKSLTPEDWRVLARFVALQDVRTPARMTEIINHASEYLPAVLKDVLESAVEKFTTEKEKNISVADRGEKPSIPIPISVPTEIKPDSETGTLRLETVAGRGYWLYAVEVLLTKTIKHLEGHRWTAIRPPIGMKWLTSDNPVVKLNYYSNGTFDLGGGWGNTGSEIFLPLSPEWLLYTHVGRKPRFSRGSRLSEQIAFQIQSFIIRNAHRYIFSEQIDPRVSQARPRTVSQEMIRAENEGWEKFHDAQTEAEQALRSK